MRRDSYILFIYSSIIYSIPIVPIYLMIMMRWDFLVFGVSCVCMHFALCTHSLVPLLHTPLPFWLSLPSHYPSLFCLVSLFLSVSVSLSLFKKKIQIEDGMGWERRRVISHFLNFLKTLNTYTPLLPPLPDLHRFTGSGFTPPYTPALCAVL